MIIPRIFSRYFDPSSLAWPVNSQQIEAIREFQNMLAEGHYGQEDSPCLCGSTRDLRLASRDRYGLPCVTLVCRSCGLLRTSPRLDQASSDRFYEEHYRPIYVGDTIASDDFFDEQVRKGVRIYNYLKMTSLWGGAVKDKRVYDIGCGAGGVLYPFHEAGCEVYGCDLGSNYLKYGRKKGLRLLHGGSPVLKKYGRADLIILSHVFEHINDPFKFLEELKSILKDDGCVYIEVPGVYSVPDMYACDFLSYLQGAHLYHYNLQTLRSVMQKAGFSLVGGDQGVRALFRKGPDTEFVPAGNQFLRTVSFLLIMETLRSIGMGDSFRRFFNKHIACRL